MPLSSGMVSFLQIGLKNTALLKESILTDASLRLAGEAHLCCPEGQKHGSDAADRVRRELTCCSNNSVFRACLQGRIIMGKPTATDIMKPAWIVWVTRLDGKCVSTLPAILSVKLT